MNKILLALCLMFSLDTPSFAWEKYLDKYQCANLKFAAEDICREYEQSARSRLRNIPSHAECVSRVSQFIKKGKNVWEVAGRDWSVGNYSMNMEDPYFNKYIDQCPRQIVENNDDCKSPPNFQITAKSFEEPYPLCEMHVQNNSPYPINCLLTEQGHRMVIYPGQEKFYGWPLGDGACRATVQCERQKDLATNTPAKYGKCQE